MCLPEQIDSCALCNEKQKKQKEKELERLGCSAKGKKCSSIETKTKRKGITSICRPLVSQPSCVRLSFFFPLSLLTVNALLFRTKTVSPNSRRSKAFRYADVLFCCMLFFFFFFFKIHEKRNKKKKKRLFRRKKRGINYCRETKPSGLRVLKRKRQTSPQRAVQTSTPQAVHATLQACR